MTVTVGAALLLAPAFGVLAARLHDADEIARLESVAADERARADMAERGFAALDGPHADAARVVADRCGVELMRPRVPFELGLADGKLSGRPPGEAELRRTSRVVSEELERYPRSFFEAARLRRVLMCGDLREAGRPIPSLPNYERTLVLDVDAPEGFTRRLVHHEVFHFADLADDATLTNDPEWSALNDRWFTYGDGGRFHREPRAADIATDLPGFLSLYSRSGLEEDKAEVFSFLMTEPVRVAAIAAADPVVARKVRLVKDRMARLDPSIDEAFWARRL